MLYLKDIEKNGNLDGIGKPEPLLGNLQGFYSRRIKYYIMQIPL